MKHPVIAMCLFTTVAVCVAVGHQTRPQPIEIVAVTDKGEPVPNLRIASSWVKDHRSGTMCSLDTLTTDGSGRARINALSEMWTLIAYDESQTMGAIAYGTTRPRHIRLVVRPLASVKANVAVDGWSGEPPRGLWRIAAGHEEPGLTDVHASFPHVSDFKLPAGKYLIYLSSPDFKERPMKVDLKPGESRSITLRREPTAIAKNYGKPALPIHVTEQRNLEKPFKLEDYRGKWVLIEFWSYT